MTDCERLNARGVIISAWIPSLGEYLPACSGIIVPPVLPRGSAYKG
jgi:hypothetical protein